MHYFKWACFTCNCIACERALNTAAAAALHADQCSVKELHMMRCMAYLNADCSQLSTIHPHTSQPIYALSIVSKVCQSPAIASRQNHSNLNAYCHNLRCQTNYIVTVQTFGQCGLCCTKQSIMHAHATEGRACVLVMLPDDCLFERTQVPVYILLVVAQVQNWVDHKLHRPSSKDAVYF
jgi:hypothetical protein